MTDKRFDWWRAMAQVLGSIEAVRDGRAMYVLLRVREGGHGHGHGASSSGPGQIALGGGAGALALFIGFTAAGRRACC